MMKTLYNLYIQELQQAKQLIEKKLAYNRYSA